MVNLVNMKHRTLSIEHRRKIGDALRDKRYLKHQSRVINTNGYVMLYIPKHPLAQKKPYVLEHRKVMFEHLGRLLRKDEIVHHINGNKQDNRIENLQLVPKNWKGKINLNSQCPRCGHKYYVA